MPQPPQADGGGKPDFFSARSPGGSSARVVAQGAADDLLADMDVSWLRHMSRCCRRYLILIPGIGRAIYFYFRPCCRMARIIGTLSPRRMTMSIAAMQHTAPAHTSGPLDRLHVGSLAGGARFLSSCRRRAATITRPAFIRPQRDAQ